jgi:hypothetical protein
MMKKLFPWSSTKYEVRSLFLNFATANQSYFCQLGMLSSPSAPERHAGCKVTASHTPADRTPDRTHGPHQVALLLAESFVAANHDIDEGDGLSDEVRNWKSDFLFHRL